MDRDPLALNGPLRALSASAPTADHMADAGDRRSRSSHHLKIPETKEP
jgi:hypothetical protein